MCKASINAKRTRNAEVGDELVFGQSSHGLPILRREEDDKDFLTCVKMGRTLTISNISHTLQSSLGIGETAKVIFVEDIDDTPDSVRLESGKVVDLYEFIMDNDVAKFSVLVGERLSDSNLLQFVDELSGRGSHVSATNAELEPLTA
jgi:hypothetical protein